MLTQGNARDAVANYEEALRLNPDYAERRTGEPCKRSYCFRAARRMRFGTTRKRCGSIPIDAEAHDNLGIALAQAGRLPEAMKHWEEALRLKPDDVEAHMNLGKALEGQGRVPEAIEHYQQALKLRPDFAPAKNALTRLEAGQ